MIALYDLYLFFFFFFFFWNTFVQLITLILYGFLLIYQVGSVNNSIFRIINYTFEIIFDFLLFFFDKVRFMRAHFNRFTSFLLIKWEIFNRFFIFRNYIWISQSNIWIISKANSIQRRLLFSRKFIIRLLWTYWKI